MLILKTLVMLMLFSGLAGAQSQWKWFKNYTPGHEGIMLEFSRPCGGAAIAEVKVKLESHGLIATVANKVSTDSEHGDTTLHVAVDDSVNVSSIEITCGGSLITVDHPVPGKSYMLCDGNK